MRTSVTAVLCALVVVTGACHDVSSPRDLAGQRYALTRIYTSSLPLLVTANAGDTLSLVGDTLVFSGPGRVSRLTVYRHGYASGPQMKLEQFETDFRLDGSHIEIGSRAACSPTGECGGVIDGELSGAAIVLLPLGTNRVPTPWRYERMDR